MDETKVTPLLLLLRAMTKEERAELAQTVGTSVQYLYHMATGERQRTAVQLAVAIEDATAEMAKRDDQRLFVVTARDIARMNALSGLTAR